MAEINGLRTELGATLERLQQAVWATTREGAAELPESFDLPVPDLAPLQGALSGERAASGMGRLWPLRRASERRVQEALRAPLHEVLALHARRLQDWAAAAVGRLAQSYQSQEELYREVLRQPSLRGAPDGRAAGAELERDLQELDRLLAAAEPACGTTRTNR